MTNASEAAARGAEFLDEHFQGWREIVRPDILDMARNDLCVGGQLSGEGDFWTFAAIVRGILGLDELEFIPWAEEHGFFADWDTPSQMRESYEPLDAAWKAILV